MPLQHFSSPTNFHLVLRVGLVDLRASRALECSSGALELMGSPSVELLPLVSLIRVVPPPSRLIASHWFLEVRGPLVLKSCAPLHEGYHLLASATPPTPEAFLLVQGRHVVLAMIVDLEALSLEQLVVELVNGPPGRLLIVESDVGSARIPPILPDDLEPLNLSDDRKVPLQLLLLDLVADVAHEQLQLAVVDLVLELPLSLLLLEPLTSLLLLLDLLLLPPDKA
mmetsp:Transcript_8609/g.14551  ORF Transcript_8609/g.14551 Transcript_8609/m.14551 type:complete len:225 (-) Transcript_8609:926-1600(-)